MNYRIEKKESFRIVGVSVALEKELEKNFEKVPKLWQTCHMDGTIKQLEGMINTDIKGVLGVGSCNDEKDWRYYIAVASTLTSDEYEAVEVPAATWAIFQGEGTGISIQELEKRIVTDWLPTSGYEYANAPDVEVYLSSDPKNMKYEVWIPVTKKL